MERLVCLLILTVIVLVQCNQNVVIDLTQKNNVASFSLAKKSGIKAVIHRATRGLKTVDKKYKVRRKNAKRIGLLWGAYHVGTKTNGTRQARKFLRTIVDYRLYPLMAFDIRPAYVPIDLKTAEEFVSYIIKVTGVCPLIRGDQYLRQIAQERKTILSECPLWLTDTTSVPTAPDGWDHYSLWRYTDGEEGLHPKTVPGIGHCPRSLYNHLTYGRLHEFWTKFSSAVVG